MQGQTFLPFAVNGGKDKEKETKRGKFAASGISLRSLQPLALNI